MKPFKLYRSSAGSGKTRTLAKEFISLALQGRADYYRFILAVTFANKATLEMKERIMRYLDDFAKGRPNELAGELKKELGLKDAALIKKSKEVQSAILHHYSQFAISTIDAFFQRVIRSFTREAGLLGNFRLEVDNELVLREVIGDLMDELGTNEQLTDWVVQFSKERLMEGENWNITEALLGFSKEIVEEEFKKREDEILRSFDKKGNPYAESMAVLKAEIATFMNFMKTRARKAIEILDGNGITANDFSYGDQGTALKYFQSFAQGEFCEIGKRIQEAAEDPMSWPKKKGLNYNILLKLAQNELQSLLAEMVDYHKKNYVKFNSARIVLKNFYSFGLLADITRKLNQYKEENNLMLLSDAPKFLNGVINNSDTPFIYEKVGSFFRNYLIDEFQDTSGYQWKNFLPLLKDSLDQAQSNMVVGDVKQSIYRWRGGDLQLLQSGVETEIGKEITQVIPLDTNYRSAENVVNFNNQLFKSAAVEMSNAVQHSLPSDVFLDVAQHAAKFQGKGYVRIGFIERSGEDDYFETSAMSRLPGVLEELQSKKVSLKDIAIIVRRNDEGQRIASYLLQYKNSPEAKQGYKYDVVSGESLRLDTASSVNLLLSALRYLENPQDAVVRGQLVFEAMKGRELEHIFYDAGKNNLAEILPEEFLKMSSWLNKLSIFELTEELIRIFNLGKETKEMAYLQAFQDVVLEFAAQEKNDIAAFLVWWENNKNKKSIQVAGNVDAVNILTIHKSKGLQFKYVIVPFCTWRFNHEKEELLWTKSDKAPFDKLGHLAVKYSSGLEESYFNEDYRTEFIKAHLDNLNLLYVAFTRAEEGLFAYAPKPSDYARKRSAEGKLGSVGELMFDLFEQNESLSRKFDLRNLQYEHGSLAKLREDDSEVDLVPATLKEYAAYDWRQKLVIKKQGAEFFLEEQTEKRAKINYGIVLHSMLSKLKYAGEVEELVEQLHIQNEMTDDESVVLKEQLNSMMNHPVIGKWFGKEWEIKTEAGILLPGGRQSRVDRINISPKKTIIIDYKTGPRKPADRVQVEEYASVLANMGYQNVEAYLLYLEKMEVVEVVSKGGLSLGL